MIADVLPIFRGERLEALRLRYRAPHRWNELQRAKIALIAEKLAPDFARKDLRKKGRHGISEHLLRVGPAALELKPIREGLKAAHFRD